MAEIRYQRSDIRKQLGGWVAAGKGRQAAALQEKQETRKLCGHGAQESCVPTRTKTKCGTRAQTRKIAALERKSPPFAKCAKDGAPSSSWCGRYKRKTEELRISGSGWRRKRLFWRVRRRGDGTWWRCAVRSGRTRGVRRRGGGTWWRCAVRSGRTRGFR